MARKTKREKYFAKKRLRQQRKLRRRRRRVPALVLVITLLLLCIASVTVFFNTTAMNITGNSKYTADEILAAGEIKQGQNLFLLNKFQVKESIKKKLTYITDVQITRKLPGTLNIKVTEGAPAYYIHGDKIIVLNRDNHILDVMEAGSEPNLNIPSLAGVALDNPAAGTDAVFKNDGIRDKLQTLMTLCEKYEFIGKLNKIDFSNEYLITMRYEDRLDISLGSAQELEQKFKFIRYIIDNKPATDKAELDVSDPKSAGYTQTGIITK